MNLLKKFKFLRKISKYFIVLVLVILIQIAIYFLVFSKRTNSNQAKSEEIRAVWIPTVYNLGWPKTSGKENQKKEMIENLNLLKDIGINRVYFQVRCRGDSFYESEDWPQSKWLTGELGYNAGYDPLLFMSEECKKRDIYLELWMNPFTINNGPDFDLEYYFSKLPDSNPLKTNKNWLIKSGNYVMLNVGNPEVRKLVLKEIKNVSKKYNADVHIDDYFYIPGKNKSEIPQFDDQKEYELYGKNMSLEDFRRKSVNQFVESLHKEINSIDHKLSVSPFAVWKNSIEDGGCGTDGTEGYDKLFCDTVKWVKESWVDCIIPQIYWSIGCKEVDYEKLAKWWNNLVEGTNVKLVIGHAIYKLNKTASDENFRSFDEISKQIKLNRSLKNVSGSAFFAFTAIKENYLNVKDKLKEIYSDKTGMYKKKIEYL
jgi:uncharacterized lipoprotein YddW (UPF0748 family)